MGNFVEAWLFHFKGDHNLAEVLWKILQGFFLTVKFCKVISVPTSLYVLTFLRNHIVRNHKVIGITGSEGFHESN